MNRKITTRQLDVDQKSGGIEFRLKLSVLGFRFLSVTVREGKAIASFEEKEGGDSANQTFFVFRDNEVVRCAERYGYLTSFVVDEVAFHLYGYGTLPQRV